MRRRETSAFSRQSNDDDESKKLIKMQGHEIYA